MVDPDSGDNTGMALLREGCARLQIPLDDTAFAAFELYYRELVAWNERLNLTSITGYAEVQTKHFLDCLVSLPLIAEELGSALPVATPLRLLDVGTGAGFPGIPLKIVTPALDLTLMDGTQKKIAFLEQLVSKLGLAPARVVHGRAEELGRNPAYREQYDLVTARAVAPLTTLAEYLLPLVQTGGLAFIFKGPSARRRSWRHAARSRCWAVRRRDWRRSRFPSWPSDASSCLSRKLRRPPRNIRAGRGWRASAQSCNRPGDHRGQVSRCSPCPDRRSCAGRR